MGDSAESTSRPVAVRTRHASEAVRARLRLLLALVLLPLAVAVSAASLLPIDHYTGDTRFEIPRGTWAQRMAGKPLAILPTHIRVYSGTNLVLMNQDDVPQIFGPTLIMPGQTFRLPFDMPAEYQFVCSAHTSGFMTVLVEEAPVSPWARLRWRARILAKKFEMRT